MHLENKLTTYSQKAEEKGMDVEKERENGRPMQIDKEFHIGVFEVRKQMSTTQISVCHGCSSPTSTKIKLCAAAAAELQHPLKEFRAESGNEALCTPGKLAGQVFRKLDILRS